MNLRKEKRRSRRRRRGRHNGQKCMCTHVHIYILIFQFKASRFSSFVLACCRLSLVFFLLSAFLPLVFSFLSSVCIFRSSLTADGARLFLCVCVLMYMCWCGRVINQLWKARKKYAHAHMQLNGMARTLLWFLCEPISIRISIGLNFISIRANK